MERLNHNPLHPARKIQVIQPTPPTTPRYASTLFTVGVSFYQIGLDRFNRDLLTDYLTGVKVQ